MSFEPRQAARAAATADIEKRRQTEEAGVFARRVAEGLGAEAQLLMDHATWGVRLPFANLHFSGRRVTCMTDHGRNSLELLITEGVGLGEASDGERFIVFDETRVDQRQLLTVTASGRVTYDSDAIGSPLPHHLLGSKII